MTVDVIVTLKDSSGFAEFDANLIYLANAIYNLSGPQLPLSPTTSGYLSLTDAGCSIDAISNIIAPANVFLSGYTVIIRNSTSSPITITQDAGLTLETAGTATTGNITLAGKGVCALLWRSPTLCSAVIVDGSGGGGGGGGDSSNMAYLMPLPTGTNDDAAMSIALASSFQVIQFMPGTYILGVNHPNVNQKTLEGCGDVVTTIKLANNSNLTALFSPTVGATKIRIRKLTFDGNYLNQTLGRGALIDLSSANQIDDVIIENNIITNTLSSDGLGVIGCKNFKIRNNTFKSQKFTGLRLDGCENGEVVDNYFTEWALFNAAQSSIWLLNPGPTRNIKITGNRFKNHQSSVFCIESIRSAPAIGISITGMTLTVGALISGSQVITGTGNRTAVLFVGNHIKITSGLSGPSLFRSLLITAIDASSITVAVADSGPPLAVETGSATFGVITSGLTLVVGAVSGGSQVITGTGDRRAQPGISGWVVGNYIQVAFGLSPASLQRDLRITAIDASSITVAITDTGATLAVETGISTAGVIISSFHYAITISENHMDGGGFRGTGVSGFFSDSNIENNILINGGEGNNAFWRNGFELFGNNCTISGNRVENGSLAMASDGHYPNCYGNEVSDNKFTINSRISTAFYAVQFKGQDDFIFTDNRITVTIADGLTLTAAIGVGTYGSGGTLNRAKISNNTVRLKGTAQSTGIRNLSSSSTDIEIIENTVSGFTNGIGNQANSNDVNLHVMFNNAWNNTTPVSGVPTGTGYLNQGNITANGQTSIGFTALLTSAQLAAMTSGVQGVVYQVTDGIYRGLGYEYDLPTDTFYPVGTSPRIYGYS